MSSAIPPVPPIPESPPLSKSFKTRRKSNSLTPKSDNKSSASLNSSQDMSASIHSERSTSSGMLGKLRKMRKGKKTSSSGSTSLDGAVVSREDLSMADENSHRASLSNSEGGSQNAYDSDSDPRESSGLPTSSSQQHIPIKISTSTEDSTGTPTRPGTSHASLPDTISPSPRRSATGIPTTPRDQSPSKSGTSPGSSSSNILGGIFGIGSGKKQRGSADTSVAPPTISRSETEFEGHRPSTAPGIHLEAPTPPTRSATATPTNKGWGVNTLPNTFVTPPTPIDPVPDPARSTTPGTGGRRSRNNSLSNSSPKKLHSATFNDDRSRNTSHPLTPTIEVPTPQPTPNIGTNNSGFFSSMFNAAQNAATSLGNTIVSTSLPGGPGQTQGKGKKGELGPAPKAVNGTEGDSEAHVQESSSAPASIRKPLAVETLGQGELSLDHLGITSSADEGKDTGRNGKGKGSRPASVSSMANSTRSGQVGLGLSTGEGDDGLKGTMGSSVTVGEDLLLGGVPRTPGYATPPQQYADDESVDGRQRSNSIKSQPRPGTGTGARRKRGSSAATSTPSLSNAGLPGATPIITRPTGFAVATTKRNRDFHNLFRSVPDDDNLIEDYGCALQKEILLQGRMYVSERHICFNSNIFGWVTTLVISFDEVVAIEKKSTAVVFPNAIVIQTLHARNVFASFISRDSTYDLLVGIWRTTHPTLQSSANGVRLGDAKTSEFGSGSDPGSDDEGSSGSEAGSYSSGGSDGHMIETVDTLIVNKPVSKKPSSLNMAGTAKAQMDGASPDGDAGSAGGGFPGPATHAATKCGDEASHYDKPLCDEIIPAPLGKVYAMAFGDNSFNFMNKLLAEDEKVLELQIPDNGAFKDGSGDHIGKKARSYQYIKPLNAPVGPKQTKCLITEVIEQCEFEKAVTIVAHTQTPDVPSGGIFKVLTRYCLMWADGNATRLVMNCTIEWSGKSWLKGPIEKGASDGQTNFCKSFVAALRREFAATAGTKKSGKGGKRRRRADKEATDAISAAAAPAVAAAKANESSWGLLSPLKAIFDPLTAILGDLGGMVLGVILLSIAVWLGFRSWRGSPVPPSRGHYHPYSHNMAFWNEMWIKEEAALWEWLDDRSRVREVLDGNLVSSEESEKVQKERIREMEKHLERSDDYFNWNDQRVEEAIRQTEEKLQALKQVVQERKKKRKDKKANRDTPKEQNSNKAPDFPEGVASLAEEQPVKSAP